ncbi:hypothetical protein MXAN_7432 [Myxococcus xanthus DK 1622]|uniref:Uncharacterized protein n=1 Tax=Myxococcus xanthus (strain DK1622) TaxID=246197 RepID=Q1CVN6_MYXXD|nr:hypothetical protein MXAN_7432 [Myxococcus xanthus DK 1622]
MAIFQRALVANVMGASPLHHGSSINRAPGCRG